MPGASDRPEGTVFPTLLLSPLCAWGSMYVEPHCARHTYRCTRGPTYLSALSGHTLALICTSVPHHYSLPSSTLLYMHAHACTHIHVHATPAVTLPHTSSHAPTHSHPARHLSPLPRTPSPPNLDAPPTQPRRVHTLHALWHTHPCAAITRAPAHTHIASRMCTGPQVYRCARLEPCTLMCLCTHAHLPLRAQV